MADYTPVNSDNAAVTLTAGATVTGGLLVTSSGADDTVVHCTSSTQGRRPLGVAAHDAASGARVSVYLLPGFIHALPAENGATPVVGDFAVASTTPGRVTSTTFSTTNGSTYVVGTFVRATTGSTGATVTSRFLGF